MGWVKDYVNDPPTRDFGWHTIPPPPYVPVDWTLSNQVIIHGASTVMDKAGVEWLTYSQGSAFGDIELSVNELKNIMKTIRIVYGETYHIWYTIWWNIYVFNGNISKSFETFLESI